MKRFLTSRDATSKGAALLIALALVVLLAGLALAYFSRSATDRQLAQSSYNDTSADLLARSALDIEVNDFKREILSHPTVTPAAPFYITPVPYGTPASGQSPIPNLIRRSFSGDPTGRTSNVNSGTASANGRFISLSRWNSHYLIPLANTSDNTIDSTPVSSFTAPDWVLVTAQGPTPAPSPNAVIGRYAFAVYDEGGLLDMSMAGYPSWSGLPDASCSPNPSATPWLVNVGRKGIMGFADLSVLPWPSASPSPSKRIDNIVGWRNYAMTQRPSTQTFANFKYATETDCNKQNWYGSYLLYFGDPPFIINSLSDKLLASVYPFTTAANYAYPTPGPGVISQTDQGFMTRQELLKVMLALGSGSPTPTYNQNVLQYMGTFSRERNRPAPDWPNLNGALSEGRFNLNNLGLLIPNPCDPTVSTCAPSTGRKKGWQTGKNRNHLFGTVGEIVELFGLFWVKAGVVDTTYKTPGHWTYVDHIGPNPPGQPDPNPHSIICRWAANQQEDFFQILHYALNVMRPGGGARCPGPVTEPRTFGIGASLIDQYDSGADCITYTPANWTGTGCDLDPDIVTHNGSNLKYATHTTVIKYGQGSGSFAFGMEPDIGDDSTNGDCPAGQSGQWRGQDCSKKPHRPCVGDNQFPCAPNESPAPTPAATTQVISHAFSNTGELGYGIDTSSPSPTPYATPLPTLDFSPPTFYDAPVLDFFSYNPISSAYPRAGIVNLYTRNAPVLAAVLSQTVKTDAAASATPAPTPVITQSDAMSLANAIVAETQGVLAGAPPSGWAVTQTDMTRGVAARLAARATNQVWGAGTSAEVRNSISRALAEMGQTRTWNLLIDVIAQTGKYKPNSSDLSGSNFVVEGQKRYWLHISLGRDLIHSDGTPCQPGDTGCQVDVLGSQLEEVTE